jgi:hypothetical protein
MSALACTQQLISEFPADRRTLPDIWFLISLGHYSKELVCSFAFRIEELSWIHIIRPARRFRMAEYDWGSANLRRREANQCFSRQVTLSQSEIWKKVNGTRQLSVSRPFSSLCEVRP